MPYPPAHTPCPAYSSRTSPQTAGCYRRSVGEQRRCVQVGRAPGPNVEGFQLGFWRGRRGSGKGRVAPVGLELRRRMEDPGRRRVERYGRCRWTWRLLWERSREEAESWVPEEVRRRRQGRSRLGGGCEIRRCAVRSCIWRGGSGSRGRVRSARAAAGERDGGCSSQGGRDQSGHAAEATQVCAQPCSVSPRLAPLPPLERWTHLVSAIRRRGRARATCVASWLG